MSSTIETQSVLLTVRPRHVGRRAVIEVAGEIDMSTAGLLATAIETATDEGALELWVDLAEVRFMDSTGLHVLMTARDRLANLNRRISVICPPGPARRVIDLAGVDGALVVAPTRWSAHHGS